MKLTELLEADRETLLRTLRGARSPEEARDALERELERLLFAYHDAAPSDRARETAAAMIGALKSALPLLECRGEVKIWEHRPARRGMHLGAAALVLLIVGCVLCLGAAALMLYHAMPAWSAALPPLGGLALALAGAKCARDGRSVPERRAEAVTDWERVYRTVHTAALVMDQTLEEQAAAERWESRRRSAETPALSSAEAELLAALLEAYYSGDGAYALDALGAVRHYLRAKGVETVDYAADSARYFDCMPGERSATLCPALLQSGQLLRRGTATVPERR